MGFGDKRIAYLRETLSNLKYETSICHSCNWVDEGKMPECTNCAASLCISCRPKHKDHCAAKLESSTQGSSPKSDARVTDSFASSSESGIEARDCESIVDHMRSILDNLHYPTSVCDSCDWVAHIDKFSKCQRCKATLCRDDCITGHEDVCGADLTSSTEEIHEEESDTDARCSDPKRQKL